MSRLFFISEKMVECFTLFSLVTHYVIMYTLCNLYYQWDSAKLEGFVAGYEFEEGDSLCNINRIINITLST